MIKCSSLQEEGLFLASKWQKIPVLFDESELKEFFSSLDPFYIYQTGKPVEKIHLDGGVEEFFSSYQKMMDCLKNGEMTHSMGTYLMTNDLQAIYQIELNEKQSLVKPRLPVILVQPHYFCFSQETKNFYSMSLGGNRIFWGLLFSFPTIFQFHHTQRIEKVDNQFLNNSLFTTLRKQIRNFSFPTTFVFEDQKYPTSFRLGRNSVDWINHHPKLLENGLTIFKKQDNFDED